MKIIIFLVLLHLSDAQDLRNALHHRSFLKPVSFSSDEGNQLSISSNDILGKWRHSEIASRKLINRVLKKLTPSTFEILKSQNISSTCSAALVEYYRGLSELKLWAFEMLDSSGKFFTGLTNGKFSTLGDFDTCIATEGPNFKGKYCLLDVNIPLPERHKWQPMDKTIPLFADSIDPGYIFGFMGKYAFYHYLAHIRTSYCLPSVCTENEVEKIFKKAIEIAQIKFNINVPFCEVKEDMPYTSGERSIIILLSCILFLVITGTVIDVSYRIKSLIWETKKQGMLVKLAQCLSVYSNTTRLLTYEYDPDAISIFHGIRVISMLWIILGHTYFIRNLQAFDKLLFNADIGKEFKFQPIMNGFLAVDTFFFVSAVLVGYVCMRLKTKMSILLILIKRYYRLTPPLMLVVALCSIAGHFGSGPFWREMIIDDLSKNCKNNGWFTMLYINNYFFNKDMCMDWTWYLSADIQLFLIGLYVVALLRKSSKKGMSFIGLLFLLGISSSALSHIYYNIPPTFLKSFTNVDEWFHYGSKGYTPAHFHLPVYCVGLCVGYILATKKVKIPRLVNMVGWITSITLGFYLVYGTYYWNQGNIPGLFISTLYGSTFRLLWAMCLAFITISCRTGNGGIINSFLTWKAFYPLSRLTYMGYLVHTIILDLYIATARSTITYSHRSMLFMYCGVVFFTFISAFLLSLLFESPFTALDKLLTKRPQVEKTVQLMNGPERKFEAIHLI